MPQSILTGALVAAQLLAAPSLSPPQQDLLRQVAADEFCGCDSALTLAGCLDKRPDCRLATLIEETLARAVRTGAPKAACQSFLSSEVVGPFCAPPVTLTLRDAPQRGPASAPLQVVEFADYRCAHCRAAMPMVQRTLAGLGKQVRFTYAPIALQDTPQSAIAAEAAMAAHAQGKFWPMHAALFAREAGDFDATVVAAIAKQAGLDTARFSRDMAAHRFAPQVAEFRRAALAAGLEGTPCFFVNGRRFVPAPDIFELDARLAMEAGRDAPACK